MNKVKPHAPVSFGRYTVSRLLGEGAMGRVYLAHDPVLDRPVAIKVIAIDKQPDQRTREEYLKRFNLEARASARLNHPSIVAIFDAGEEAGIPWIAFEYVDGDQLETLLSGSERLPVEKITAIVLDIAAALHHAHESGIVHRDIKPANILIDKRTRIAKLSDFGVVKAPWVALTQDGTAVGSPGYMSPEQLDGTGADERSDLFSLGIVLYQMLTGKHPFLRDSIPATIYATLHSTYDSIDTLRPDAPEYLAAIVNRLLMHDPAKRFQSAARLLHELRSGSRGTSARHKTDANAFDREAYLGNTTRLHRISQALQTMGKKGMRRVHEISSSPGMTAFLKTVRRHCGALWHRLQQATCNIRFPGTRRHTSPFILPVMLIALLLLAAVTIPLSSTTPQERKIIRQLKEDGYRSGYRSLIDTCADMLEHDQPDKARKLAVKLTRLRRTEVPARIILARIALREEEDEEVMEELEQAVGTVAWHRSRRTLIPPLLNDCSHRLMEERADSTFIAGCATYLGTYLADSVPGWLAAIPYWQRWNGVHLAEHLNVSVDSTAVYILDMQHAGSVRTRTHAATRLGELGDERAVEPLKTAAELGFKDPILSYTAKLVLENYFGEKEKEGSSE
ncbi:MAG: serine/threonine protein kinase [Chitinispirillaceae bacterium]|nr:serine/threonine protein kinase [Chitinispirillaceae bacterium]